MLSILSFLPCLLRSLWMFKGNFLLCSKYNKKHSGLYRSSFPQSFNFERFFPIRSSENHFPETAAIPGCTDRIPIRYGFPFRAGRKFLRKVKPDPGRISAAPSICPTESFFEHAPQFFRSDSDPVVFHTQFHLFFPVSEKSGRSHFHPAVFDTIRENLIQDKQSPFFIRRDKHGSISIFTCIFLSWNASRFFWTARNTSLRRSVRAIR